MVVAKQRARYRQTQHVADMQDIESIDARKRAGKRFRELLLTRINLETLVRLMLRESIRGIGMIELGHRLGIVR